ncbi:MAG: hypothetical protein RR619_02730 [Raoultibacter sp.]
MPDTIDMIVEDGSIVDGANSYVTIAEARKFALSRSGALPEDDEGLKANLINATDYVDTFYPRFGGRRVDSDQPLQFPRSNLFIFGGRYPNDKIPKQVKDAVCQLAIDIQTTGPLQTESSTYALKRTKIEGLEQEFAVGSTAKVAPTKQHQKALGFLTPLFSYAPGDLLIR